MTEGDESVSEEVLSSRWMWVHIWQPALIHETRSSTAPPKTMIRPPLTLLTLLAMTTLCVGTVRGQSDMLPMSRTVGSVSLTLPINKTSLVALPNVKVVAAGKISAVDGDNLTLVSGPAVLPALTTVPHAIKITSRNSHKEGSSNAYGISATITAQSSQVVTADLSTAPNVGDEYVIIQLSTLGSLFGATNTAGLLGGATSAAADIVNLTHNGEIISYFYSTAANGWRLVSAPTGADQANAAIDASSGIMVTRRATGAPVTLRLGGELVGGRHTATVGEGFTIVNNPFMLPTTLATSGLEKIITGGSGPGSADVIYLENEGVLTGYYYKNAGIGDTGWRALGDHVTDSGAAVITPGKALLFKDQAGDAGFALSEPFAE